MGITSNGFPVFGQQQKQFSAMLCCMIHYWILVYANSKQLARSLLDFSVCKQQALCKANRGE
jgi:hypothetical protein